MSDCCSGSKSSTDVKKSHPRKKACPLNQHEYALVEIKTILHHLAESWNADLKQQAYYYCNDPECDVAYFAEDGSTIKKSQLRTNLSSKDKNQALICYCFGVSMADAKDNPEIKNFVIQQTKVGNCSCETSNPSGRCCLKDFPKI